MPHTGLDCCLRRGYRLCPVPYWGKGLAPLAVLGKGVGTPGNVGAVSAPQAVPHSAFTSSAFRLQIFRLAENSLGDSFKQLGLGAKDLSNRRRRAAPELVKCVFRIVGQTGSVGSKVWVKGQAVARGAMSLRTGGECGLVEPGSRYFNARLGYRRASTAS